MRANALVTLTLSLACAAPCFAQVTEPNGLVVPLNGGNGEIELNTFFAQRGENIDWIKNAHSVPATFSPQCDFNATFVLNQAGEHLGLAWYNANPNAPPAANQLYLLLPAGSAVGTMFSGTSIIKDPNYTGGDIGFALVGNQTHYSEQKWNVNCTSCMPPAPWILALIYQSTLTPNAFYIAFEDGTVTANGFDNDGDFNDDVFFVTGINCVGAGVPCNTGMPGICGDGLTQCDGSGGLTCKQLNMAGAVELCDGLDNNCNGMVDEGAMCPMNQVCDRGACVEPCGASEFACDTGYVCTMGVCIEMSCVGVTCPSAQVCHQGTCQGACDGIICPHGQVCRVGRCVDPCLGVTCPMNQVCQSGVCVTSCTCQPCAQGTACQPSGQCGDPACVTVACDGGTFCQTGACVDDCAGAICPAGQVCSDSQCIPFTPPDMSELADLSATTSESDGGTTTKGDGGPALNATATGGCGCRVAPAPPSGSLYLLVSALLGAMILRSRSRRRSPGVTHRAAR